MTDTAAWLKPGFEEIEASPHCDAVTRAGKPCGAYAMKGQSKCAGHSGVLASQSAAASAKSAQVRRDRVLKRQEAVERSKLSPREHLAVGLSERWLEIQPLLLDELIGNKDWRGLLALVDQAYGKPGETLLLDAGKPDEMALDELVAWLSTAEGIATESPTVPETQS